ncbi:hypothetical protein KEJ45_00875 [Candidatus Bathyarchaeota archaeon]|nr:hypothetical protein [Candidatus Bathyarchaeota archaeon]
MSFRDYLHEKAEESRHNETTAYLIFLAGTIFFIGGLLESLFMFQFIGKSPEWFLFIPYYTESHTGAVLGLALIICGLILVVYGILAGINYSHERGWYLSELQKANSVEEVLMSKKRVTNEPKQKPNNKKPSK